MPPTSVRFSRKTVLAAIDVLTFTHAELTRFLLNLGPIYATKAGEGISLAKRFNEFISIYDRDPDQVLDDGELLSDAMVEKAASQIQPVEQYAWSDPVEEKANVKAFRSALARDGFAIVDGTLRRTLPVELGIAAAEDEITRLLTLGPFSTSKGNLDQALDAHGRGDWAAANSQTRSFFEALLDEIAIAIDPTMVGPNKGEARRARLGAERFLRPT